MTKPFLLSIVAALFMIVLLSSTVSPAVHWESSASVRYRITVTVETPEGLKSGSAVREVFSSGGLALFPEQSSHIEFDGEAVAVDLGTRGVLFALTNEDSGYGISYVATCDLPFRDVWDKKTPSGTKWTLSPGDYPQLVTFKDLKDPTSMEPLLEIKGNGYCGKGGKWDITADHFEVRFGKGVKLKEIVFEKTDAPVTREIEKWLPWLPCIDQPQRSTNETVNRWRLEEARRQYRPTSRVSSLAFQGLTNWRNQQERKVDCTAFLENQSSSDRAHFQDELKHWQPLADQGSAEAMFKVGILYQYGDGYEISRNPNEAVKWYTLSANQGYQDAQEKLAHIYEYKEGVPQDWQESYFWASLAILGTGGHKLPNNQNFALSEAPKHLTPDQKLAVEKRVREWKPVITPGTPPAITDPTALSERLLDTAYAGQTEMAKLLVDRGADINTRNKGGNTPLMLASMQGDVELVRYLIDKGADINAIGSGGWTALFMAAQRGHTEVAKVLLEKGIDFSVKDKAWGRTAQQEAEVSHHMDTAAVIAEFAKKQNP